MTDRTIVNEALMIPVTPLGAYYGRLPGPTHLPGAVELVEFDVFLHAPPSGPYVRVTFKTGGSPVYLPDVGTVSDDIRAWCNRHNIPTDE